MNENADPTASAAERHSDSMPAPVRRAGFSSRFRARIMAGLVLIVPIWFTYLVVTFVFRLMRDASLWLVEAALVSRFGEPLLQSWGISTEQLAVEGFEALPLILQWSIGGLAVLLTIVALYVLGAVTTNVVGNRTVRIVERLVEQVPFVTVVYHASKKVLETLTGEGAQAFQRVVLVPFPNEHTRSVGFVTSVTRNRQTGEPLYSVFVATAPNPTTGFVFVIEPVKVVEVDWSVEDAVKVIMSGGVLMPESVPCNKAVGQPSLPINNSPTGV